MSGCSAYGCTNCANRAHYDRGITFHKFPHSQPERLQKWIQNMRRKDWKPSKTSLVCSMHFLDEYFDRTGQTVRLRANAEPTIFVFSDHRQKNSTSRKQPKPKESVDESTTHAEEPPVLHLNTSDHSYAVLDSPRNLKHRLDQTVAELQACKKKLKVEQQRTRRLKKKVSSLHSVIESLHNQNLLTSNYRYSEFFKSTSTEVFQKFVDNSETLDSFISSFS